VKTFTVVLLLLLLSQSTHKKYILLVLVFLSQSLITAGHNITTAPLRMAANVELRRILAKPARDWCEANQDTHGHQTPAPGNATLQTHPTKAKGTEEKTIDLTLFAAITGQRSQTNKTYNPTASRTQPESIACDDRHPAQYSSAYYELTTAHKRQWTSSFGPVGAREPRLNQSRLAKGSDIRHVLLASAPSAVREVLRLNQQQDPVPAAPLRGLGAFLLSRILLAHKEHVAVLPKSMIRVDYEHLLQGEVEAEMRVAFPVRGNRAGTVEHESHDAAALRAFASLEAWIMDPAPPNIPFGLERHRVFQLSRSYVVITSLSKPTLRLRVSQAQPSVSFSHLDQSHLESIIKSPVLAQADFGQLWKDLVTCNHTVQFASVPENKACLDIPLVERCYQGTFGGRATVKVEIQSGISPAQAAASPVLPTSTKRRGTRLELRVPVGRPEAGLSIAVHLTRDYTTGPGGVVAEVDFTAAFLPFLSTHRPIIPPSVPQLLSAVAEVVWIMHWLTQWLRAFFLVPEDSL
jgi:hypothetical protein